VGCRRFGKLVGVVSIKDLVLEPQDKRLTI